jgi:hypothetical protein
MAMQKVAGTQVSPPQSSFNYFWKLCGEWAKEPNDVRVAEMRRHSSFTTTDWNKLDYFYKTAFGSAIKGL